MNLRSMIHHHWSWTDLLTFEVTVLSGLSGGNTSLSPDGLRAAVVHEDRDEVELYPIVGSPRPLGLRAHHELDGTLIGPFVWTRPARALYAVSEGADPWVWARTCIYLADIDPSLRVRALGCAANRRVDITPVDGGAVVVILRREGIDRGCEGILCDGGADLHVLDGDTGRPIAAVRVGPVRSDILRLSSGDLVVRPPPEPVPPHEARGPSPAIVSFERRAVYELAGIGRVGAPWGASTAEPTSLVASRQVSRRAAELVAVDIDALPRSCVDSPAQ